MTLVLRTRADLTLDGFRRVAWGGEGISIHDDARDRMRAARKAFLNLIDSDETLVIYGVTSGYGQHAHMRLNKEERKVQARRPPQSAMTSFGEPLPERVVRGIVFARLANFIEGHAALTPGLADAVAEMLNGGGVPPVPTLGNGCPGEILALSHLFHELAARFELEEKDSLSLINGSPCASGLVADAAVASRKRLELAIEVFALSIEAFKAPLTHYDPALELLWDDPFERDVLERLRGWLKGAPAEGRRYFQAPVSWRILPRVLGQAARTVAQAEEVAAISLRAVSDNPVYLPPHDGYPLGRVMSTGGYHNGKAYPAMDHLATSWADLALLADRHTDKMLNGRVSMLPELLKAGEGYIGCLAFTCLGYAEQARQAAQPSFLPGSEAGGYGQNDVATPVFLSWRKENEAGRCFDACLAILAAICSQALYVTEREPLPRLKPLVEMVRDHVPPVIDQRPLAYETESLARAFTGRVFSA